MSRIKSRATNPEIQVRKIFTSMGFRYRLNRKDLPGSPDLVIPRLKLAVFVHGCFWHRHDGCKYAYIPKSRIEFWKRKFDCNLARDARVRAELEEMGWQVLVVWECELNNPQALAHALAATNSSTTNMLSKEERSGKNGHRK